MLRRNSSSDTASPESAAKSHSRHSGFPGRAARIDRTGESDMTSSLQNSVSSQSSVNPSSEIRSRRRAVPLLRGSSDSCVGDQLELVQLERSPVTSRGHRFISANLSQPTWCDKCGDFIWGVYKQCLICTSMLAFFSSYPPNILDFYSESTIPKSQMASQLLQPF